MFEHLNTLTVHIDDTELAIERDDRTRVVPRSNSNPVIRINAHRPRNTE